MSDLGRAPRYPDVVVSTDSGNPLVLVAKVRQALRRQGVARDEIGLFSSAALEGGWGEHSESVCRDWVSVR